MIGIENNVFAEIKETLEIMFSIEVTDCVEINRGLLNLKWKVVTNKGTFFVKQYNEERYPASKEERLNRLKSALLIQRSLSEEGIRCPSMLAHNGEVFLRTKQDTRFIITDYIAGKLVEPGKINCCQFYDLGIELGKIHSLLNSHAREKTIPRWVVTTKEQLLKEWNENWNINRDSNTEDINRYLGLQKEIFEDIDMTIFEASKPGWAHSDLWCDNILFYPNALSAIIDFDRFQYIYPELDISRAILSFALDNDFLKVDEVKAFMDGYNQHGSLDINDIVRSLKLLYCLESFWWLNLESFNSAGPPRRFAYEMVWLSNNWHMLERVFK